MDDGDPIVIVEHSDFEWLGVGRRTDEHSDVCVVGIERSPVVSECMRHVVVGDTVLAGARLNVQWVGLRIFGENVNIC